MRLQIRIIFQIITLLLVVLITGSAWAGSSRQPEAKQKTFRLSLATEMLTLVNQARAEARTCGNREFPAAAPLQWNDKLASAALKHAEEMARRNYFSHTSKSGATLAGRVKRERYDFRMIGENIASTTDVASAVDGWLSSPGHCANLMNADFTEMGAAFASASAKAWETRWVQVLGTRWEKP